MINNLRLILAVAVLAGVDLAAAVALKEARERGSLPLAMAGATGFLVLAAALYYASALTDLTWISLAWIVTYQAAVMAVDHLWFGVTLNRVQLAAVLVAGVALIVAGLAGNENMARD